MSKKKAKIKARRRARKLQDQAWEAAEADNLQLAHKLLDQALRERQDHPEIWNDYGLILQQMGQHAKAEKALRNAILIAPRYAEAYANLAALVAGLGRTIQAERLQRQAVAHAPDSVSYRERLAAYQALVPDDDSDRTVPEPREDTDFVHAAEEVLELDRYDWTDVERQLTEQGYAVLERLLSVDDCVALSSLYPDDERFEKTVNLEGAAGQHGAYRFFRRPLPLPVQQMREAVYARLVPIANRWNEMLGRADRWPSSQRAFLAQCEAAGQSRTTPILLRYRAPAVNHLHQDVWGKVYFPLQLAITLSARGQSHREGFRGGAFVFADEASGRKSRRAEIPTDRGDGVLFCTRERLVPFGTTYALQGVRHGMAPLFEGERYVLGVPFHDYK